MASRTIRSWPRCSGTPSEKERRSWRSARPKEVHAWTVTHGSTASQAAGVIHTDFERGFIRAEVITVPDFVACKGEQGAKEAGKMRLEGREYVVKDGDVMHFRF